jgi:hypothetical protein
MAPVGTIIAVVNLLHVSRDKELKRFIPQGRKMKMQFESTDIEI